ncbi:MAG: hypothetical protein ABJL86_05825 [Gilvibacter sp.]
MKKLLLKIKSRLFDNWDRKKRHFSLKLDEFARASSYAIHR